MKSDNSFPPRIRQLGAFDGPFEAYRLAADDCEVLFGSYPAGTKIEPHSHATENVGIILRGELILTLGDEVQRIKAGEWYEIPANAVHAAEFPVETSDIEFWFSAGDSS